MKKNILTAAIITFLVTGSACLFFLGQNKNNDNIIKTETFNKEEIPDTANQNNTAANIADKNNHPYIGDDFTIIPPRDWVQTEIPSTLIAYRNQKEIFDAASAADKIHFKSYFAVSFDNTNGQNIEKIVDLVKKQTESVAPSVVFEPTLETVIDGFPARTMEASLNMQNIDFKVLVAIIITGEKYYTISFNTTANKWPLYKDMAYNTANSFKTK